MAQKGISRLGTLNEAQEEEEKGSFNNSNSINFEGSKRSQNLYSSSQKTNDMNLQRLNSGGVSNYLSSPISSFKRRISGGELSAVNTSTKNHLKSRTPVLDTVLESAEATTLDAGKKIKLTASDLPTIKESQEGVSRHQATSVPYPLCNGYGGMTYDQQHNANITLTTFQEHLKKQRLLSQTKGIIKLIRGETQNNLDFQQKPLNNTNIFQQRKGSAPLVQYPEESNVQENSNEVVSTPQQTSNGKRSKMIIKTMTAKGMGEIPSHILQLVQNQINSTALLTKQKQIKDPQSKLHNIINNSSINTSILNKIRELNEHSKQQVQNNNFNERSKSPNLIKLVRDNFSMLKAQKPAQYLEEPQQSQQFEISSSGQYMKTVKQNLYMRAQKMSFNSETMEYQQSHQDFDSVSKQIYNSEDEEQEFDYDEFNQDEFEVVQVDREEEEEDQISQSIISVVEKTNSRTETTLKNTISEIKQKTISPTPSQDLKNILGSLQPQRNLTKETNMQFNQSSQSKEDQPLQSSSITNTLVSSPDGTLSLLQSPDKIPTNQQKESSAQMLTIKPIGPGSSIISSEDEERRIKNMDKLLLKMAEQYPQNDEESKNSISLSSKNHPVEKTAASKGIPIRKMTIQQNQLSEKAFLNPNDGQLLSNNDRRLTMNIKSPQQSNQSLLTPANLQRLDSSEGTSSRSIESRSVTTTNNLKSSRKNGHKKINQYIRYNLIGQGAFSKVYRCVSETDGLEYAMKIINKKKQGMKYHFNLKRPYNFVDNEVAILKKMNHENVFTLYEIIDDPNEDKLYIITEFVRNGTLEARVNKRPEPLQISDVRKYFLGLVHAIEYCHDCASVMHRDIKLENILLDENDDVKLADFGVSQMIQENGDDILKEKAGTQFYFCPEMCKGKEYRGKPADVWACGVVLYYMVTKRFPFVTNNSFGQELFNKILHEDPDYSDIEDPRLILLLKGILRKDPNKRLKIEQIKKHAWTTDNGAVPIKRFNTKKIVLTDDDLKQVITNIVKVQQFVNQLKRKSQSKLKSNNNPIQATLSSEQEQT